MIDSIKHEKHAFFMAKTKQNKTKLKKNNFC